VWPIDLPQGTGKQEVGMESIFVAEGVHITMLHRQLCLTDLARSCGSHFGLAIFWAYKKWSHGHVA
jgi:hypothetical protein